MAIYLRARKQAEAYKDVLNLTFNDKGITVIQNGKKEEKRWDQVVQITIKPTLVVIYTDIEHGYILTGRVLGKSKNEFIKLVNAKKNKRK